MKDETSSMVKIVLLAVILMLLVYLIYLLNSHLGEVRDLLNAIKDYIRSNPVDTFPPIP